MNSLRHLLRRSSKNCDPEFANTNRFKENYSIDDHGHLSWIALIIIDNKARNEQVMLHTCKVPIIVWLRQNCIQSKKRKEKVHSYIARYTYVAVYSLLGGLKCITCPPLADMFIPTSTQLLIICNSSVAEFLFYKNSATLQLLRNDTHVFPQMLTVRDSYNIIQLSELNLRNGSEGPPNLTLTFYC